MLARLNLLFAMTLVLALGASRNAFAFHDGGVASCEGCHTMHNSKGNVAMGKTAQFTGVQYLLQGSDQSSTCLKCHSSASAGSYKVMTYPVPAAGSAPLQLTPGGDFAYVGKTYNWVNSRGQAGSSIGARHGHNVVAVDQGLTADTTLTSAPGGTYPATSLSCISCHDPHGKFRVKSDGTIDGNATLGTASEPIVGSGSYGAAPTAGEAVGVYRLLGGTGYSPKSSPGGFAFGAGVPTAVAPSAYNRSEATSDTRVAYGAGMSEWCANCHSAIHNDSLASNFIHPASNSAKLTAAVAANYNAYVKSGDLTNTVATSYSSMIPYEEGTTDRSVLVTHAVNDGSVKTGPDTNANVMCLSCHRAHASAWDSMTRWNVGIEFLTIDSAWPGNNLDPATEGGYGQYHTGKTQTEYQQAMYGRAATTYASFQRSLCNKCHAKD